MKDFITSLIIGIVLVLLSSTNCFEKIAERLQTDAKTSQYLSSSDMTIQGKGEIPQYPGDSDTIVQGNGDEDTTEFIPKWQISAGHETKETEEHPKIFDINKKIEEDHKELSANEETTILKGEEDSMNEMLISFWHGVASVLIGELFAILVAFSWAKIHRKEER